MLCVSLWHGSLAWLALWHDIFFSGLGLEERENLLEGSLTIHASLHLPHLLPAPLHRPPFAFFSIKSLHLLLSPHHPHILHTHWGWRQSCGWDREERRNILGSLYRSTTTMCYLSRASTTCYHFPILLETVDWMEDGGDSFFRSPPAWPKAEGSRQNSAGLARIAVAIISLISLISAIVKFSLLPPGLILSDSITLLHINTFHQDGGCLFPPRVFWANAT